VHLLTLEAFEIYFKRLKKPSGILCVHITNTYLDLKPVVFSAARSLGLRAVFVHSERDERTTLGSDWILLSAEGDFPKVDPTAPRTDLNTTNVRMIRPWTDDFSNLIQIVNY